MDNYLSHEARLAAASVERDRVIVEVRNQGGRRVVDRTEDTRFNAAYALFHSGHRVSVQVSLTGKVHYGISSAAGLGKKQFDGPVELAQFLLRHVPNLGTSRLAQAH